MITITARERLRAPKPEGLDEKQSKVWDFYFERGWYIFLVNTYDSDAYLVIQDDRRLEYAIIFPSYDSLSEWLSERWRDLTRVGLL